MRAIGSVGELVGARARQLQLTFSIDPTIDLSFLEAVPMVHEVFRHEGTVRVTGEAYLMAGVAGALSERQIDPPDLAMVTDSLEDVFIALTGTELRD